MEGKIYQTINAVMKEIGAIGKNKRNTQGAGFMYRGIDDVMNALEPAMEKNGLFVVPEVLEQSREERTTKNGGNLIYSICKIKFTFYAEDGSNVQAVVIGEAMDSGDKATNKAMSIAFKYACFQVFCIPTEEMKDPDAECHEPLPKGQKETKKSSKQEPAPKSTEPVESYNEKVDAVKIAALNGELQRTGVGLKSMLAYYKLATVEEMDTKQWMDAMAKLKKTNYKKGE